MKKSILCLSVLCLALASCENYYVEKLLDHTTVITDVQSYKITLSSSDYGSISTLEANISLAFKLDAERGNTDSAEYKKLLAIADNKYFENDSVAAIWLPAFIASKFPQLSAGSTCKVTYKMLANQPEYMAELDTIGFIMFTEDDYASIWGNNVEVPYLTPATESLLPRALKAGYTSLEDGVYAVEYMYSPVEPAQSTADEQYMLTQDDYRVLTEYVQQNLPAGYMHNRSNEIEFYFGANVNQMYINNDYAVWRQKYDPENLYSGMTDADMVELHASRLASAFLNLIIPNRIQQPRMGVYTIVFPMGSDATNTTIASLSFMYSGQFIWTSYSFSQSPMAAPKANEIGSRGALYKLENGAWNMFDLGTVNPYVLTTKDYASLGVTCLDRPQKTLSDYLAYVMPYAAYNDKVCAVYRNSDMILEAAQYTFIGSSFQYNGETQSKTTTFTKADTWIASSSVYLSETFADKQQGDFIIQDVLLTGGLNYVWAATATYGMKASAYYKSTYNPAESWLLSPYIDLTEASQPALICDMASKYVQSSDESSVESYQTTFAKRLQVFVSADFAGDVTDCNWELLPYNINPETGEYMLSDGASWDFISTGYLDLSMYDGQVITLGFRYISTDKAAATWEIKNLVVTEVK